MLDKTRSLNFPRAALSVLLSLLLFSYAVDAIPHGDDHGSMEMDGDMHASAPTATASASPVATTKGDYPMSYFAYQKHSGTILAHIVLMVLAWFFVLPVGMHSHSKIYKLLLFSLVLLRNQNNQDLYYFG